MSRGWVDKPGRLAALICVAACAPPFAFTAYFFFACWRGNPKPTDVRTLDGPERPEVAQRASGWLLVSSYGEGVDVVELPSLARTRVRVVNDRIRHLAGPDRTGRFVYVASLDGDHELRWSDVRGERDAQLFERPGDPWMGGVIGGLQLSAQGRLAFWSRPPLPAGRWDPWDPPRRLEILDLDSEARRELDLDLAHGSWCWHPDGRRLVLTRASPYPTSYPRASQTEVTLVDVDTGEESAPIGNARLVLADQEGRIWMNDLESAVSTVRDVTSGQDAERSCPWTRPIAVPGADLVLAEANPTTGVEVRFSGGFKMAWGVVPTLKLFDVRSCEFVTVFDWLEFPQVASFGAR